MDEGINFFLMPEIMALGNMLLDVCGLHTSVVALQDAGDENQGALGVPLVHMYSTEL